MDSYAQQLADAVDAVLAAWVERCVALRAGQPGWPSRRNCVQQRYKPGRGQPTRWASGCEHFWSSTSTSRPRRHWPYCARPWCIRPGSCGRPASLRCQGPVQRVQLSRRRLRPHAGQIGRHRSVARRSGPGLGGVKGHGPPTTASTTGLGAPGREPPVARTRGRRNEETPPDQGRVGFLIATRLANPREGGTCRTSKGGKRLGGEPGPSPIYSVSPRPR